MNPNHFQMNPFSNLQNMMKQLIILLLAFPLTGISQDVLTNYENLVNPLTGDFNWSQGLISIQSKNGQSYPISIGYNAEIKTNQPAGWVGLGWNLNVGEINRSINGFPDDHKAYTQTEKNYEGSGSGLTTETTVGWGPMYHTSYTYGVNNTMDVVFSSFSQTDMATVTPAFDNFSLSSSLANGAFSLQNYETEEVDLTFKPYENNGTKVPASPRQGHNFDFQVFQMENDPFRNNYIVYYTNQQIAAIYNGQGSTADRDFIDYYDEEGTKYDRSGHAPEAIGAFMVQLANGTRLHFSLPVFQNSFKSISFDVDDNGDIKEGSSNNSYVMEQATPVAISWKLTAITGPAFREGMGTGAITNAIDDQDQGYWLKFYYGKWYDTKERTPEYDVLNNAQPKQNKRWQNDRPFRSTATITEKENYYIDKIESDREALIFYKSIRNDEYAATSGTTYKVPQLKLHKVVRYYKENLSINKNNSISTPANFVTISNAYYKYIYTDKDYSTGNDSKAIKGIDFTYDYSLQPGYYKNINNYSTTYEAASEEIDIPGYSGEKIYQLPNLGSATEGKLTLKSIQPLENDLLTVFDDFDFEYSTTSNPAYNHNHYNVNGGYQTMTSRREPRFRNNLTETSAADTWRLNKIKYPSKTVLKINYELDQYEYGYSGYNEFNNVIPVKRAELKTQGYASGANLLIDLYSTEAKDRLAPKPGRIIRFYSKINLCDPSGTHTISSAYLCQGIIKYDQNGSVATGTSLNYLSDPAVTPTANQLFFNVPKYHYPMPPNHTDECGSFSYNNSRTIDYAYFTVEDETYFPGTHRVKELQVLESDAATQYYSLSFNYSTGYSTNNLLDASINMRTGNVSFGNQNTGFNSVAFQVLYGQTTITKKGLDGNKFHHNTLTHRILNPLAFGGKSYTGDQGKCFIPSGLLNSSVKSLWEFMHEEDYEPGISMPALMECAIETYIKDQLIPNDPNITLSDYSDWEKIANNIPGGTVSSMGLYRLDGSIPTLYCTYGSGGVECGEQFIQNNKPPSVVGSQVDHYPIYHTPSFQVTHDLRMRDYTGLQGILEKIESFDGNGNLVLETDYEYDLKAYTANNFRCKYETHTVKTDYRKNYYYPRRKYIFSKGMRYTEEIMELHPTTGMPVKVAYLDPSKGVSQEVKEYLLDDSNFTHNKKAAKTEYYGTSIPLYEPRKRIGWQYNQNYGLERGDRHHATNMLEALKQSTSTLYNITPGYRLFNGTNDLTLLNQSETVIKYDGQLWKRNTPASYSQYDLNSNSPVYFDPYVLETEIKQSTTANVATLASLGKSQLTVVNEHFNPMETYNTTTKQYSATRYSLDGYRPIAALANTTLGSFTATGFEDTQSGNNYFEGEVSGAASQYIPTPSDINQAHSGTTVCRLNSSSPEVAFACNTLAQGGQLQTGRTYLASVWVNNQQYSGTPGITVSLNGTNNGASYTQSWSKDLNHADNVTIGDWTKIELEFTVPEGYLSAIPAGASGNFPTPELKIALSGMGSTYCYFDDLRFHPIEAALQVNLYDQKYQRVTYTLDADNQYIKYEYDAAGRVIRKTRESIHGIYTAEENTYND